MFLSHICILLNNRHLHTYVSVYFIINYYYIDFEPVSLQTHLYCAVISLMSSATDFIILSVQGYLFWFSYV